jgi:hypothetical protein
MPGLFILADFSDFAGKDSVEPDDPRTSARAAEVGRSDIGAA